MLDQEFDREIRKLATLRRMEELLAPFDFDDDARDFIRESGVERADALPSGNAAGLLVAAVAGFGIGVLFMCLIVWISTRG